LSLPKKAIGKRFGLLSALVAALVIACAGVVFAQTSSSATYPGYEKPTQSPGSAAADHQATNGSTAAAGDVSIALKGVPNGGFENGSFGSTWKRANQKLRDNRGNWYIYSDTQSPLNQFVIPPPPQGSFAATTDQDGPGAHVLTTDLKLAAGKRHKLSFYLYYHNFADRFFTPNTLDPHQKKPNQQYRVDLLKPGADPFSVKKDDILANIFRTEVGDPNVLDPTRITYDLTPFAGQTVRLRFAEVDNQDIFLASVDAVAVHSKPQ
jgi:hypothetical protein